jgi:hypothetical protein
MRTLRYASLGFVLGVLWGVVGRIWMYLIADYPSVTVLGTLQLLVVAGVAGLALGVMEAARRRGASAWWRMLALVGLVIFNSQGAVLLPAAVLGGWGLRRGRAGRVVAGIGILSAPILLVVLMWEFVNTHLMPYPDTVYRAVLAAGGLLFGGTAAWASSIALGPWRGGAATAVESDEAAAIAA